MKAVLESELEANNAVIMMTASTGLGSSDVSIEESYAYADTYFDKLSYVADNHPINIPSFPNSMVIDLETMKILAKGNAGVTPEGYLELIQAANAD